MRCARFYFFYFVSSFIHHHGGKCDFLAHFAQVGFHRFLHLPEEWHENFCRRAVAQTNTLHPQGVPEGCGLALCHFCGQSALLAAFQPRLRLLRGDCRFRQPHALQGHRGRRPRLDPAPQRFGAAERVVASPGAAKFARAETALRQAAMLIAQPKGENNE